MKLLIPTFFAICTIIFSGCGTSAHRIDTDKDEGITSVRGFDFKDYQIAAEDLISKLLSSDRLPGSTSNELPIIMVSQIKNSTAEHLNTQLLTQKVTIALDKSNLARTTTVVHKNSQFDPGTRQVRDLPDEEIFDPNTLEKGRTVKAPRLSLAGEITELYRTKGRKRESYYQIYLTVTDMRTGIAIWQDAREIAKQDKKALLGL